MESVHVSCLISFPLSVFSANYGKLAEECVLISNAPVRQCVNGERSSSQIGSTLLCGPAGNASVTLHHNMNSQLIYYNEGCNLVAVNILVSENEMKSSANLYIF